jgi:hypothetical protein
VKNCYLSIVDRPFEVDFDVQTLAQLSNKAGVIRTQSFIRGKQFTFVKTDDTATNNHQHRSKEKQEF